MNSKKDDKEREIAEKKAGKKGKKKRSNDRFTNFLLCYKILDNITFHEYYPLKQKIKKQKTKNTPGKTYTSI